MIALLLEIIQQENLVIANQGSKEEAILVKTHMPETIAEVNLLLAPVLIQNLTKNLADKATDLHLATARRIIEVGILETNLQTTLLALAAENLTAEITAAENLPNN
jgi:hypothetical protein